MLYDRHATLGAKIVEFGGWEMPLFYPTGIVEEHLATRKSAGLFDVSHMGRLFFSGPDAAALLKGALTYNIERLNPGRGHYTLLCNQNGGIIDDAFVYRLNGERFLVVGNAANADRDREHIAALVEEGRVDMDDRQSSTVMIALQGPRSRQLIAEVLGGALVDRLPRHGCVEFPLLGSKTFIAQGGYTGEDGFEVIAGLVQGRALWEGLIASGVQPCGLGARDTLRLEAALMLHGHEINEKTDPFEAGLGWVVDLDERDFVGKEALVQAKEKVPQHRLVCLKATEKGVMRDGNEVFSGDLLVGRITSGSFSPTLQCSIGMAYVRPTFGAEGTVLEVDVRGRRLPVVVVKRPFYKSKA
jgi:aminomethyltransferase